MKSVGLSLVGIVLASQMLAQEQAYFTNPVIRGDVPDPSIIRIEDTYYATGTSSEWAPFYPLFTSHDLVNWEQAGHIFDEQPEWTQNSFWAPELFYHNGKVYCYYSAREKATGLSYIGVAIADSPTERFVDYGPVIRHGKESIDAFVYDDNGQLYISWKAYGLEFRPIEILGSRLSADGLHLEGEPFTMLTDEERVGMEGQYHFRHGDYYYIVYASHGCCGMASDYNVCVARSKSFTGPYEKYSGNPILHGGEGDYQSCGHGTAVETPDGRMFYMCHAYLKGEGFFAGRQPILQEMEMTEDNWVRFKTGSLAKKEQPIPFEGTKQKDLSDFEDKFEGSKLKVDWTWNYPYSDIDVTVKKGRLFLSGTVKKENKYGTALCLRPQSAHYSCETRVIDEHTALKGLTLYGDDKNLIVWGVSDGKLLLKVVKDGVETVIHESVCLSKKVFLKLEVEQGCILRFYESNNGKNWNPIQEQPFDGKPLIRWDRVQRPGLIHCGDKDIPSEFTYFKMKNLG